MRFFKKFKSPAPIALRTLALEKNLGQLDPWGPSYVCAKRVTNKDKDNFYQI